MRAEVVQLADLAEIKIPAISHIRVRKGGAGGARRAYGPYRGGQCADPESPRSAGPSRAGFPDHRY